MSKELKKILFVDDDEDIHLIVKLSLHEIPNLEFRSAYSGEDAIKIAMEFLPDLILLDVMMPKMDGFATLQAIRLMPTLLNIPIIFLTARVQKAEIETYLKLGVLDVITKPFDPATFAPNILKLFSTTY